MSMKSKYSKSSKDCGCGTKTYGSKSYGQKYCCNNPVQPAPEPCCESHDTMCVTEVCFRPTCGVTASEGTFYLRFKNAADITPLNANDMYFYHASAGFMRIVGYDDGEYAVRLVDETNAGAMIAEDDCVTFHATSSQVLNTLITTRCLSGKFTAPAVGEEATIYVFNGSAIPIGATLTFTAEGVTGSYTVVSYESSANNIYVYQVENTGSGHVPGTIIDAGDDGACVYPIEIITQVDNCSLSEISAVDHFVACAGGSSRAFVPSGPGDIPYSADGETWETRRLGETDCCVVTEGAIKFSGSVCPSGADEVVVSDVNISCFETAWDAAAAAGQTLPANINGYNVTITDYDSGTNTLTLAPAEDEVLAELVEFPSGSQICLGSCCSSCLNGPQVTDPNKNREHGADDPYSSILLVGATDIDYTTGDSQYLIGFANAGLAAGAQTLDAAYFANPSVLGPKLPKIDDRHLFRQKICNTSPKGCKQLVKVYVNYELSFDPVPTNDRIYWELAHFADVSATLKNGAPNPFGVAGQSFTRSKASGYVIGPSINKFPASPVSYANSSFGSGLPGEGKTFPAFSGTIVDIFPLDKCECVTSAVWFFVFIRGASGPVALNVFIRARRYIEKLDYNGVALPANISNHEGWAV